MESFPASAVVGRYLDRLSPGRFELDLVRCAGGLVCNFIVFVLGFRNALGFQSQIQTSKTAEGASSDYHKQMTVVIGLETRHSMPQNLEGISGR